MSDLTNPAAGANSGSASVTRSVSGLPSGAVAGSAARLGGEQLYLLAGLASLGALATNIILPAFPGIARDLATSVKDLGATLGAFFIAFAVGQLFVGPLSDRFGRRWLVAGGLLVFALGSLGCALADTLPQLIGGRIVQALGACSASVLARAIARDLFDGEDLGRALALIMVAMAAAPGFSPLLGGVLEAWIGWRATFGAVGLLALVLGGHYLIRLGETHAASRRSPLSVVAVAATYRQLLGDPRFIAPALAVSLVLGSLYAFFAMAPALLMEGHGFSSRGLGLFFASTVFVVFGAGSLAPRLAGRYGAVSVARAGLAIALAGGSGMLAGGTLAGGFAIFAASMAVFLLGMGLVNPLATAIALQPFGHQAGAASALLGFLQMSCAALTTGVGTALALPAQTALGLVVAASLALALASFVAFVPPGPKPGVRPAATATRP